MNKRYLKQIKKKYENAPLSADRTLILELLWEIEKAKSWELSMGEIAGGYKSEAEFFKSRTLWMQARWSHHVRTHRCKQSIVEKPGA